MQELIFRCLILLHIFTGLVSMVAAIVAFGASKWSKWHRYAGITFYWGMLITSLASIPPAVVHQSWVLMMISVFSFHLTYSGRRFLQFRRGDTPRYFDYAASVGITLFGIGLFVYGIPLFYQHMGWMGVLAPALFGWVSLNMGKEDYDWYRGKRSDDPRKRALTRHIVRMGGATIAVYTAFFVNLNLAIPGGFAWIFPAALGSFGIAYYKRKLRLDQPIK